MFKNVPWPLINRIAIHKLTHNAQQLPETVMFCAADDTLLRDASHAPLSQLKQVRPVELARGQE